MVFVSTPIPGGTMRHYKHLTLYERETLLYICPNDEFSKDIEVKCLKSI